MTDISVLKSYRKGARAAMTRFSKWMETVVLVDGFNKFAELEERLEEFKLSYKKFDNAQLGIEGMENDNSDEHEKTRQEVENKYFKYLIIAKKCLKPSDSSLDPIFSTKLPQIKTPEFSGSYDKLTQFRDIYKALIHNNRSLSDVQKFYHLQSSLKHEAAQVTASLSVR